MFSSHFFFLADTLSVTSLFKALSFANKLYTPLFQKVTFSRYGHSVSLYTFGNSLFSVSLNLEKTGEKSEKKHIN